MKKIRANTEVSIKGEYHKIDIIKTKLNGKKINSESYSFCYDDNDFVTKFNLKNISKNFKYFICFKRARGCEGKALYDIQKKEFKVYNSCNFDIDHNNFNYEEFVTIYNNNTFDKIDMNLKKFQRYYIRILFSITFINFTSI